MAQSSKRALWIALVVVGLGGVGLWWWQAGRAMAPPTSTPASASATANDHAAAPSHDLADPGATPIAADDAPPVLVTKSGAIVKDRTTNGLRDVPDPVPPGSEFNLKGVTTATGAALGTAMLPVVAACGALVPAAARGQRPMVQPAFAVHIASGQLTVTDVAFSTRDIDPSVREAFTGCIKDKAMGTTITATGEADLDRYRIHIPMKLPAL